MIDVIQEKKWQIFGPDQNRYEAWLEVEILAVKLGVN